MSVDLGCHLGTMPAFQNAHVLAGPVRPWRRTATNPSELGFAISDGHGPSASGGRRLTTRTRTARRAASATSPPRRRPRTLSTRPSAARTSKGSGERTPSTRRARWWRSLAITTRATAPPWSRRTRPARLRRRLQNFGVSAGTSARDGGRLISTPPAASIGIYDTQEDAARADNAAIRRAGLEGRRKTNPVVDGQLVPKPPRTPPSRKRRRDESTAAEPSPRARRRR